MLDNLATVPKAGLRVFVGTVSPQVISDVREALLFALGFDSAEGPTEAVIHMVEHLGDFGPAARRILDSLCPPN